MPPPAWLGDCWHQSWTRGTREPGTATLVAGSSVTRSSREVTTQPSWVAPGPGGFACGPGQASFQMGATWPGGAS